MDPRHKQAANNHDNGGNDVEEEGESDMSEEEQTQKPVKKERKQRGSMLTGRGVTMQMLIDEAILEPGEKLLSIDYLGKKFEGDLLEDGQIRWCETGQIFTSPSSWAMYCKKLVNPTKKSGCGWASVRYKGRKLDQFKPTWFRNQRQKPPQQPPIPHDAISSPTSSSSFRKNDIPPPGSDNEYPVQASVISPTGIRPLLSPMSEQSSLSLSLLVAKPKSVASLKSPKETGTKRRPQGRPPGRPPKSRTSSTDSRSTEPSEKQLDISNLRSPPHLNDSRHMSHGYYPPVQSPPGSHHSSHHSRSSQFSPPIPGRTGNVMTFSQALEMMKNQSARKMEQASSPSRTQLASASSAEPKMSPMPYVVHGRVYKKKPGRPPKDSSKPAAIGIPQSMPHRSAFSPPATSSRGRGRRTSRTRMSMKHANVHPESDPLTLVECAQFASIGKIQPFSVTMSTNSLLLIDFHCHLSTSEVTGYLAGKWDSTMQHLKVTQTYPCKCRIADKEDSSQIEAQIRKDMEQSGLCLVGWYHSHPFCQPDPTLQDIKNQLKYQQVMEDESSSEPCIGLIVSPYDSHKKESAFKAFWVQSHSQTHPEKLALPLGMSFTTQQDQQLSQDVINEMVALVNFYKGNPDSIKFTDTWTAEATYLDKIKHSAIRKFPQDQTDGRFLDFITKLLVAASS